MLSIYSNTREQRRNIAMNRRKKLSQAKKNFFFFDTNNMTECSLAFNDIHLYRCWTTPILMIYQYPTFFYSISSEQIEQKQFQNEKWNEAKNKMIKTIRQGNQGHEEKKDFHVSGHNFGNKYIEGRRKKKK